MNDDFKAGYQKAIDDLCNWYDKVHKEYQELWKNDNANSARGYKLQIVLIALNAAICDLEVHKEYNNVLE